MTFGANGVSFFKALGRVLFGKFLMGGFHIPWGSLHGSQNQFGGSDSIAFANGEQN